MQNELIDGLFRRDSMTALGSGAGAAVGRRGSGGGGGLSPHVLGSKSSVGCESECGVLDGSNAGNSSSSSGEMFGESLHPKNRWGGNFKSLVDCPHFERNVG